MEKVKFTRSDIERIKGKLAASSLPHNWLIARLSERGVEVDKFYLSKLFGGGSMGGDKAAQVISTSLQILGEYERTFRA